FAYGQANFWAQAEERLRAALDKLAREAADTSAGRRRLFAEDAAHGMAFIEVCHERFDVIVMNPPFGASSAGARSYIQSFYRSWRHDILSCFVSRALELLRDGGVVGCISSRTPFFLSRMEQWRRHCLYGPGKIELFADLGYRILDEALVEVAAYVI